MVWPHNSGTATKAHKAKTKAVFKEEKLMPWWLGVDEVQSMVGHRRGGHALGNVGILKEIEHEFIEQLEASMLHVAAIFNHTQPHVALQLSEALGSTEKNVILVAHDHEAFFITGRCTYWRTNLKKGLYSSTHLRYSPCVSFRL